MVRRKNFEKVGIWILRRCKIRLERWIIVNIFVYVFSFVKVFILGCGFINILKMVFLFNEEVLIL